ncbi:MAG: hypothetical protein RI974_91 [Actinomycetota bacterium]
MLCPKGRVGSNPTSGTKKAAIEYDRRFFFLLLTSVVTRYRNIQCVAYLVNAQ